MGLSFSVTLEFRFSGIEVIDGLATTLGYSESSILSLHSTVAGHDDLPELSLLALLLLLLQEELQSSLLYKGKVPGRSPGLPDPRKMLSH